MPERQTKKASLLAERSGRSLHRLGNFCDRRLCPRMTFQLAFVPLGPSNPLGLLRLLCHLDLPTTNQRAQHLPHSGMFAATAVKRPTGLSPISQRISPSHMFLTKNRDFLTKNRDEVAPRQLSASIIIAM